MQLLDLLSRILQTHALSLQALRHQLGHSVLLERIALLNLRLDPLLLTFDLHAPLCHLPESSKATNQDIDPYAVLDDVVVTSCPHPDFEFHLWSYPLYRSLVESDLPLGSMIPVELIPALCAKIDEGARHWLESLLGFSVKGSLEWAPWDKLLQAQLQLDE